MIDPAGFPAEAERLARALGVDVRVESMPRVQAWLTSARTDANALLAGCFAGEVIRRKAGGAWQSDGTIAGVGHVAVTMPLAKANAGEDLVAYVDEVLRYAE